MKSAPEISLAQVDFLIAGFVTAFIVALLSIKFLLRFIQTHTFIPFGIYRIILVVVLLIHLKMA
jgi:undecaprenyl-diphosphatase